MTDVLVLTTLHRLVEFEFEYSVDIAALHDVCSVHVDHLPVIETVKNVFLF